MPTFKPLKIALAKSECYRDLYTDASNSGWKKTVFSSQMRSGPIGLFSHFDTRFFVIKQDEYATDLWKQKITDCNQGVEADYLAFARKPLDSIGGQTQSEVAESASQIDWSCFDIVIAMDACISAEITGKFSDVLWCYYISEGCMAEYQASRGRPFPGYHIFLNQRFRHESDYLSDPNISHEIDFPYHLMDKRVIDRLLGYDLRPHESQRIGIFIEKDSRKLLTPKQRQQLSEIGPLVETGGSLEILLRQMSQCKYFLRLGCRAVWGNASIEAVACGMLIVSSTRGYRNRIFGGPPTMVTGIEFTEEQFGDALARLARLEEDSALFGQALLADQRICSRVCFDEPMNRLLALRDQLSFV